MKLEKAIIIQEFQVWAYPQFEDTKYIIAKKLGIEALKRIQAMRRGEIIDVSTPLPGETEVEVASY